MFAPLLRADFLGPDLFNRRTNFARVRMTSYTTRQRLAELTAEVARRDALIQSWTPVGGGEFNYEHLVRGLYPSGFTVAYTHGVHSFRSPLNGEPAQRFDYEVHDEGGCLVATHIAYAHRDEPYALVAVEPHRVDLPSPPAPPGASPELLAALALIDA
jgi:hypothetical protein